MTKHLDIDTKAMRDKILDLAIRGKLTDQRQEDGNARDLLKKIQAEKERLIKEKKIKKGKPLPEITEEEKPFDIPNSWEWVRLGEIGTIYGGGTPKTTESDYWNNGTIAWIRPADMNFSAKYIERGEKNITEKGLNKSSAKMFPKGSVIISTRAPIGYVKIAKIDACTSQGCKTFGAYSQKLVLSVYIYYVIQQRMPDLEIRASGTTFKEISGSGVAQTVIPLPPFAEQKRIADKVSKLFAQLDAVDKAYEEYQELQRIMKAKLLELAIQGKLTDQRKEDGDAWDLFQDIQEEKQRLIAEKKIKKEKLLPEIEADEIPFEIPTNWMWVRINDLFDVARGGSPRPIKAFLTEDLNGINWIKIGDTEIGGKYIYHVKEKIKPEGLKKSRFVKNGDLLLTNSMSYGRPYILKTDGCIHDGWLVLSPFIYSLNKEFFYYLISSQYVKREFTKTAVGAVVKNLNKDKVKFIIIPLPPLAEQQRIVAKLDELLPLL